MPNPSSSNPLVFPGGLRWFIAFVLFVLSILIVTEPLAAQTESYGDIIVSVRSQPKGSTTHGYSEYVFSVNNRSDKKHTVTLILPSGSPGGYQDNLLRSVSRTVSVDENSNAIVALLYPDFPPIAGNGIKVIIDGREQERVIPLNLAMTRGSRPSFTRRGYGSYSMTKMTGSFNDPLVLVSPRVGEKFRYQDPSKGMIAFPGSPVMGAPPGTILEGLQRSTEPVTNWSPRWLAYSRYDGIVLMRDELDSLERGTADLQAIRLALIQYVEAGGCLLLLGGDGNDNKPTTALPSSWKANQSTEAEVQVSRAGFGLCLQVSNRDASIWNRKTWDLVTLSFLQTPIPFQTPLNAEQVNSSLPIINDIALPVRGLFILMLLFSLAIGPFNIWLLSKWNRRIWLLWTVPLLSLLTCLSVFGYMIIAEGWQGRTLVSAFTLLDEKEQRATTLGRSACYSPLTPGDGLHFNSDAEINLIGREGSSSTAVCDIDWTRDQHLNRGWVSARLPAQFQLRRSEIKRLERLPVSHEADGSLQVTNQLGSTISRVWLADAQGQIYTAEKVPIGQRAPLKPYGQSINPKSPAGFLRNMYMKPDWAKLTELNGTNARDLLRPGSYLAIIDSSPFLEPSLRGAEVKSIPSAVLGLMANE